jgi:hypothetical protein
MPLRNNLMEKAGTTKCVSCREKVKEAVVSFNKRYETLRLEAALKKTEEIRREADVKVTEFLKKKYCIDNNITSSYPKDTPPAFIARFTEKNSEMGKRTEELNNLVKEGVKADNLEAVLDYQNKISETIRQIEAGFTEICQAEKTLCGCYSG